MMPPAPALFSITNGLPSSSAIFAVTTRATMSTAPPAGNGSSNRIGLSGYSARAGEARVTSDRIRSAGVRRSIIVSHSPGLFAVEIKLQRGLAENLAARLGVRHRTVEPVDRGLVGKLPFVTDERAVARPHQAIGPRGPEKLARVVLRLRPEPVAARQLHPGAALFDGLKEPLEALAVDAGARLRTAEMIDHDPDA